MAHQPAHEEPPASIDGPSDLGSSSTDTESRKKAEGQHQQSPSGQEQVNETNASTEEATAAASTSASALSPAATPTPTGHDEGDKGEEASEVGRGGSAVRGGKRPPRPPGSIRQGRKDKRKAGWEAKKALVKEKKRAAREQREESMREAGLEIPAVGTNYRDLPREQWSVSQKIRNAKREEFEALSLEGGYRVCVDMAFDDLMVEKARASMVQQILYLYGANRKAAQPCRVTLSGMGPDMDKRVRKLQGFDTWLGVTTDTRCYTEVFEKEELVYLTADSPNTITQLEKGKVYILGGLVDRNAHKGLCFRKATDHGIATAKLPLKKGDLRGTHSKVLATNHVFDVLVRAMGAEGDLQKIEHQTLPPRKRAGWTGGDDRGPSSKPKDKSGQSPAEGEEDAAVSTAADGGGAAVAAVLGSAAAGAAPTSAAELAVGVGAESASVGELPAAVGGEPTSVGGAGAAEGVKSGGDGVGAGGASAIQDVEMGGDGVSVGGERRPEGATNNQAEDHPAGIASNEGRSGGKIEPNGGEQAGKSEDGLEGGDGTAVDVVGGKRTAPDAGLGVDAKRAKTADGDAVA